MAVARALGRDPAVLLLDEPLSALDAHTRAAIREELAEVLAGLQIPTLIVTHDFLDAQHARGPDRRDPRRPPAPDRHAAGSHARPADAFVASLTGGNLLHGNADGTR